MRNTGKDRRFKLTEAQREHRKLEAETRLERRRKIEEDRSRSMQYEEVE